ncbi:MAG TPA: DUF5808 domain-containing protein, partial [Bacteroidia bacterium]|nr:DUF5808 domain-containing protein [Bacteroidia bacterium]
MEKQEEKPDKETLKAWMNDPANIRWGIFYYNPKDKRLFPAKRYGLGWTVNFANRNSILAMVTVVIII